MIAPLLWQFQKWRITHFAMKLFKIKNGGGGSQGRKTHFDQTSDLMNWIPSFLYSKCLFHAIIPVSACHISPNPNKINGNPSFKSNCPSPFSSQEIQNSIYQTFASLCDEKHTINQNLQSDFATLLVHLGTNILICHTRTAPWLISSDWGWGWRRRYHVWVCSHMRIVCNFNSDYNHWSCKLALCVPGTTPACQIILSQNLFQLENSLKCCWDSCDCPMHTLF